MKTFISELLSSWSGSLEPNSELGAELSFLFLCLSLNLEVRFGGMKVSFLQTAEHRGPAEEMGLVLWTVWDNDEGLSGPRGTAEPWSPSGASCPPTSQALSPSFLPSFFKMIHGAFRKPVLPPKLPSSALSSPYSSRSPILSCLFIPTFDSISFRSYPCVYCET